MIIKFRWKNIDVDYNDGNIDCFDLDGNSLGSYTMGETMIVGSTIIPSDIRKEIKDEIQRTIDSYAAFEDAFNNQLG